ncbi:peptidase [Rhizobium dioscoreae]|uniref:serine hydrolase n=1 Tax=Rhizobium dioscoreae TaxID=2653122 RepID=UPI0012706C71|nr:serine hydrolase [Rhizobium dioscoreae]GES47205.1 peptidase [Rhizobium dioscoreae]
MKARFLLALGIAALMSGTALADTIPGANEPIVRGNPVQKSYGVYIDQMIADFIEKNQLPGLTLAIVQAPYIPRSSGYGKTSIDRDELASTKTMWNIGPITQAFTAVAVMQLKEQGKLKLDDMISKYVDNLPSSWKAITVLELLQHSSGIPDYREKLDESKQYSPKDLVALVGNKPLHFESGTKVEQSATNYTLLAMVIERASGMSYHDFIWKYQIDASGLPSTMFAGDMKSRARTDRPNSMPAHDNQHSHFKADVDFINPVEPATGYREVEGHLVPVPVEMSENLFGFGNIWSSAEDISKWDIALAGSVLIKDAADREVIYTPTKLANGTVVPAMAGWEFTRHPGFMEVKGKSPGFSAYLSRFTASYELVCVTLLTDKEGVDLTTLARNIAAAYRADLGPAVNPQNIVAQESKFGPAETVARIKDDLAAKKVPLFATFDHAENATSVGDKLRPTTVLVFGNPKIGTKLMQEDQSIGIDLPLRVLVWEDEYGRTWVGYPNVATLVDGYRIKDQATVATMTKFLEGVVGRAANVYSY